MELIFSGSVARDETRENENEDVFEISFIEHGVRIALSDGATVSYDSKEWGKALISYFIKNGKFTGFELRKIIKKYYSHRFSFKDLTPVQKVGLKHGSFATILGIEYNFIDGKIQIFGVGDSVVVLTEDGKFAKSFPCYSATEFGLSPQMLSTRKRNNMFFAHSDISHFNKVWTLEKYSLPVIFCMSDALAEFAFSEMEKGNITVWEEIAAINNTRDFKHFVHKKRESNSMKIDDTTLISLRLKL